MLLENKTAIVYGGAGAIGSAVARVFAAEGATVHLVGRTRAPLEELAGTIAESGGRVEVATLDATDRAAVEQHGSPQSNHSCGRCQTHTAARCAPTTRRRSPMAGRRPMSLHLSGVVRPGIPRAVMSLAAAGGRTVEPGTEEDF
ncbi:SDR family NAD(P)-dependent oxidoreductase [Streptomyces sp. NPDC093589]|uniref:SDR family NAD(P)-dependent oxidoreductase n=1 Tax=Streptomyces sp. NPDC093589 TaxID=3366043 RepID=UPI00382F9C40